LLEISSVEGGLQTAGWLCTEILGIERCGFHAFRHGNATAMDQEQVPIATRQNRLGQSDARTTMGYTHAISQDGRVFAARFGQMLTAGNA
jgi:integrase